MIVYFMDIMNYFRISITIPIAITFFIAIIIVPIALGGEYEFNYSTNEKYHEKLVWPTPNFKGISSYFGKRNSPTTGASTYHSGVDILAYQGSKVISAMDGNVIFAGWSNSGGYMVKIQHENGIQSAYCHMGEVIYIKKGEYVKAAQTIGTVGPKYLSNGKLNGATTGVHLHFAITKNGKAVNPLAFSYK